MEFSSVRARDRLPQPLRLGPAAAPAPAAPRLALDDIVGKKVKKFLPGHGYACGTITEVDTTTRWYMIEYDDGTPSSAPQMAHDVSEYLAFVAKAKVPDQKMVIVMFLLQLMFLHEIILKHVPCHFFNFIYNLF